VTKDAVGNLQVLCARDAERMEECRKLLTLGGVRILTRKARFNPEMLTEGMERRAAKQLVTGKLKKVHVPDTRMLCHLKGKPRLTDSSISCDTDERRAARFDYFIIVLDKLMQKLVPANKTPAATGHPPLNTGCVRPSSSDPI
jgi:hypothetical protein